MHDRPGTIFPLRTELVLSVERHARFCLRVPGLTPLTFSRTVPVERGHSPSSSPLRKFGVCGSEDIIYSQPASLRTIITVTL